MPQYLSPGVYVEEVDAGPKPIEGVSTSVAGAVGVTARGPDRGKPVLVTSFAEYVRTFGGPVVVDPVVKARWTEDPQGGEFWTFPLAVKGFFDNGGQQLYVKRVIANGATPAAADLGQGVMTFVTRNAQAGATQLKLDSLIGIVPNTAITLSIDGTALQITPSAYDNATNHITFAPALPNRVQAGRDFVTVRSQAGTNLHVSARSAGAWGSTIQVRVRPMDAGAFAVMADPSIANNAAATTQIAADVVDTAFTVVDSTGINVNDWIVVNGTQYKVIAPAPAANKVTVDLPLGNPSWTAGTIVVQGLVATGTTTTKISADVTGATFVVDDATNFPVATKININNTPYVVTASDAATKKLTVGRIQPWSKGWSVIRVRVGAQVTTVSPSLFVWNASSLYKNAFVEIEDPIGHKKFYGQISDITGNKVTIDLDVAAAPAFSVLEGQRIHLIEGQFDIVFTPSDGPQVSEQILNVRFAAAELNDPMFVTALVSTESNLIDVTLPNAIGSLGEFPMAADTSAPPHALTWATLAGGTDNFGALDADAFVGLDLGPGHRSGIQALEDIDDISITMAPSMWSSLIQNGLIQQAELLKYRFAIIDPPPVQPNAVDVIDSIRAFRSGFDTKYAALYFPRIEARDPFTDTTIGLGPSGHMAGIYANVDIERGVYKAPANEVIHSIDTSNGFHGLETEITKREQDLLNPVGINALRWFPNRGTRVWGARTLSSDGSWKYINVRRIFIFVERSIDEGTQWVVFEPNDEKTWARVRQSIANFLTTVWRSGALFGTKADEAFFVRCDRTTMTQDDIDNGRLICVIGIAPVKPAEFVIFRIQQKLIDQTQP